MHIGHRKVIEKLFFKAEELNALPVLFTFDGNLKGEFCDGKCVYSFLERKKILESLNVKEILFAPTDKEFLSKSKEEFLEYINGVYDIVGYVAGKDYKFGKCASGDVEYLGKYAKEKGQELYVVDTLTVNGEKVSTTTIKKYLESGEIKKANELLGSPYLISGKVYEDRKIGRILGFPTVNIKIEKDKVLLKDGVYSGHIYLDKKYRIIANYGARPTFDLKNKLIEAHIIDFDGTLYGKEITLFFDNFIRDVIKFDDVEGLKQRLVKDLQEVKEGKYD